MAAISLTDLVKSYGKTEVLHHIKGEIHDGELIVIVGPSGCGKSTLLRMVAGLESVSSGEIRIGDRVVNNLEPAERDIAMVFQNYALYPHMSVFQNMAYGLKIRGLAKDDIRKRVEDAADILEIRPYLERRPRELSGGQRQRVAMGRAIVRDPQVFLFDEPLSNLDAKLRVQMRMEIRHLQQRLGVTSIYVTHDQVEAMTLGDRLMVLNQGYVEQFGTPIELYERPATTFVAGFIGSPAMNFMSIRTDGSFAILPGDVTVDAGRDVSTATTFGVRPEHLSPDADGPFKLQLDMLEQLGANTLAHGKLAGSDQPFVVSLPGIQMLEANAILSLSCQPEAYHFFDEHGKRIN
ncbi:MAG: sn-glycerol-3-phosphate import ATP-binding protein UgpC [Pseudomonadota bacterium]